MVTSSDSNDMAESPEEWTGRSKPLSLTLCYTITSFLFIALVTVATSYRAAEHCTANLVARRENIAVVLGKHLNYMYFNEFVRPVEEEDGVVDLENPNHMRQLSEVIHRNSRSIQIESVFLYDRREKIVYATDMSLIGLDGGGGRDWRRAIQGEIVSDVERPGDPVEPGHSHIPLKSTQVVTYMPTRYVSESGVEEGPILGVMEFHQDASDLTTLIALDRRRAILSTLSPFGILFVLLLLVVRWGDAAIRARTRQLECEIARREQAQKEILAQQKGLRHMALELSIVEGRERRRLATYLHDETGQVLSFLRIKFGQFQENLRSAEQRAKVSDLRRLLEQAIEHTQSLTFDMSPPVLHELGIIAAVEEAVDKVGNEHGIDVKFSDDGLPKQMDPGVRDLLFQAVRELMVNVVKHAQASSMGVSVFRENGCILISVEDNGIGFDTSHIGVRTWNGGGFGLASMRERFGYIEGRVEIECIPGHGARVTLVAPLLSDPLTGGRAP